MKDNSKLNAKYLAPALTKGLDVLELLSSENTPITFQDICSKLNMSKNQLFRTIFTLNAKGYIEKYGGDKYMITYKLFTMGLKTPFKLSLSEIAIPIMKEISKLSTQSCHLIVRSGTQMVVSNRVENPDFLGFSVRVGHRKNLTDSTSGLVLLAYLPKSEFANIMESISAINPYLDIKSLKNTLQNIRDNGHLIHESFFLDSITDISIPILNDGDLEAVGAISIPYINRKNSDIKLEDCLRILKDGVKKIEAQLII